ncbi:MAG: metallophosphoesterase [Bacteroidetes bacterium]|jgi:hypothetical protein|nr:metallophosphoesterase [Bacteroidota bacterium]
MSTRSIIALLLLLLTSNISLAGQWTGQPEVITGREGETVTGFVFDDSNLNSTFDQGERGVQGVHVSNGREWVTTDETGAYEIEVRDDMDLTIVQPSGWRVPTDERMVPQFFYIHKEGGTGYDLRFGGLPPTGPAPAQVNFPLTKNETAGGEFSCAVLGDPQTYSNEQVGWLRDGVLADVIASGLGPSDCMIFLGDVVGDDLTLLDRLLEVTGSAGIPQWSVIGNHDIDFDATSNNDKADSWRRLVGPTYYAFELGDVLFISLDNVVYPCGEKDVALGHSYCGDEENPRYNGRVTETQLEWLEGLIEITPEDRLIVLNSHIPFVSFVDDGSRTHQTDEVTRIYDMLEGRKALSLSGHTHTIENHAPGQFFAGWTETTGAGPLPFRHIIAGAASGAWFQGDFSIDGVPMALQRMGAPKGFLRLDFDSTSYSEQYIGARLGPGRGQWIGLNTPSFREWFDAIMVWNSEDPGKRSPVPPVSINDLPDPNILTPDDLADTVWLTANVWAGSAETTVEAQLPDGTTLTLERTQQGQGEVQNSGAEWADPFAAARQLSVARFAFQSRSGNERAQGHELYRGNQFGPAPPQPQRSIAHRNMHLWRAELPDLPLGVHQVNVTSTDRNGHTFSDTIIIEVREERPPRYWRHELWEE